MDQAGGAHRLNSLLEAECLGRSEFLNYQEAYRVVTEYILFYNDRRMHGSLYDLSPEQFRKAIQSEMVQPLTVKV